MPQVKPVPHVEAVTGMKTLRYYSVQYKYMLSESEEGTSAAKLVKIKSTHADSIMKLAFAFLLLFFKDMQYTLVYLRGKKM